MATTFDVRVVTEKDVTHDLLCAWVGQQLGMEHEVYVPNTDDVMGNVTIAGAVVGSSDPVDIAHNALVEAVNALDSLADVADSHDKPKTAAYMRSLRDEVELTLKGFQNVTRDETDRPDPNAP